MKELAHILSISAVIVSSIVLIISMIQLAKHLKTKNKLPSNIVDCRVTMINPESNILSENFGITDERMQYLVDKANEYVRKKSDKVENTYGLNMSELLEEISKECKHPNELAVICLQIGGSINNKKATGIDDFLNNLLKD